MGAAWWHKAHLAWILKVVDAKKKKQKQETKSKKTPLNVPSLQARVPMAVAWLKPWHRACLHRQGVWPNASVPRGLF